GLRETPNSETENDYVKLYQACWDPKPGDRPLMSSTTGVWNRPVND
ncbi:7886_t:CDS:2, partial [Ambispora gerdemannii]